MYIRAYATMMLKPAYHSLANNSGGETRVTLPQSVARRSLQGLREQKDTNTTSKRLRPRSMAKLTSLGEGELSFPFLLSDHLFHT